MLTKTYHTLIKGYFASTCVHIHLLILCRHLNHLVLLIEDLLLQIHLTVLVSLWVLSQICLINHDFHLWILSLYLLRILCHLVIALRCLVHIIYHLVLLSQSTGFHTITFYFFVLNMTLCKNTVYPLLILAGIVIVSLSIILAGITWVTRLLCLFLLVVSLAQHILLLSGSLLVLNLWLVLHH